MDVSRYLNTTELKFTIEFVTPTFLGGPDGNAQIRTAPFKSLLRRWWRIVNGNLTPEELWEKESNLFGSTKENPRTKEVFGKSKIILKIQNIEPINYLAKRDFDMMSGDQNIASYLGFGPIDCNGNVSKQYIKPGTRVHFSLTYPSEYKEEIEHTLLYMNIFGSLGSRSRKGWGSILVSVKMTPCNPFTINKEINFETALKDWKKYPHCLGFDKRGILIWRTKKNYTTWEDALTSLGLIYKDLAGKITNLNGVQDYRRRKILGSPVKTEDDKTLPDDLKKSLNARIPSQLIYKITKIGKDSFYGMIFHLPYAIPNWDNKEGDERTLWKEIHNYLDNNNLLAGYYNRKVDAK